MVHISAHKSFDKTYLEVSPLENRTWLSEDDLSQTFEEVYQSIPGRAGGGDPGHAAMKMRFDPPSRKLIPSHRIRARKLLYRGHISPDSR